eukprot:PhF_6_TR34679/c0_g1_i1/m.50464
MQSEESDALNARLKSMMERINVKQSSADTIHHKRMVRNNEEKEIMLQRLEEDEKRELERLKQEEIERLRAEEEARREAEKEAEARWLEDQVKGMTPRHRETWIRDYNELVELEAKMSTKEANLQGRYNQWSAAIKEHEDRIMAQWDETRRIEREKQQRIDEYNFKDLYVIEVEETQVRDLVLQGEREAWELWVGDEKDSCMNATARTRARTFSGLDDDTQEKISQFSTTEINTFLDELEEIRLLKLRLEKHNGPRVRRSLGNTLSS